MFLQLKSEVVKMPWKKKAFMTIYCVRNAVTQLVEQGSYMEVWVKFKDFSRLFYSFQGLKVKEKYWSKC